MTREENESPARPACAGDAATSYHVRRARIGDEDSRGWIVTRFSPLLLLQAEHRMTTGMRALCEPGDLVNEVWLVTLGRLGDLKEHDGRMTPVLVRFLSTTLLNRLNHLLRTHLRARASGRAPVQPPGPSGQESMDRIPAEITSMADRAARDEVGRLVRSALSGLGEQDREILVLRGIEQVSNQEICRALGLTPSAVSMRYARALERLRERLPATLVAELLPPPDE